MDTLDYYCETIQQVLDRLEENPNDIYLKGIDIWHSDIIYARVAVNTKFGTNYSNKEIHTLLAEEGLIDKDDRRYVTSGSKRTSN